MEQRQEDIIDEIHKRRSELLRRFNHDLDRYAEFLREREQSHPERVVEQIKVVPSTKDD